MQSQPPRGLRVSKRRPPSRTRRPGEGSATVVSVLLFSIFSQFCHKDNHNVEHGSLSTKTLKEASPVVLCPEEPKAAKGTLQGRERTREPQAPNKKPRGPWLPRDGHVCRTDLRAQLRPEPGESESPGASLRGRLLQGQNSPRPLGAVKGLSLHTF